jgi:hypothetical protein
MKKTDGTTFKDDFSVFGDPDAQDPDPEVRKRFFGKYRGMVMANIDPLHQGRLLVKVPDVTGLVGTHWAMPCVPMAGPFMGSYFVPPAAGAGVWIEFEQGDPEQPIWVGCFWAPGQIPMMAQGAVPGTAAITLETLTAGVSVSDQPMLPGGSVNLHVGPATFVTLGMEGITIKAPQVNVSTALFSVNGTKLTVLGP